MRRFRGAAVIFLLFSTKIVFAAHYQKNLQAMRDHILDQEIDYLRGLRKNFTSEGEICEALTKRRLETIFSPETHTILSGIKYKLSSSQKVVGELDFVILDTASNLVHSVIEVKCRHSISLLRKARKQLRFFGRVVHENLHELKLVGKAKEYLFPQSFSYNLDLYIAKFAETNDPISDFLVEENEGMKTVIFDINHSELKFIMDMLLPTGSRW